MTKFLKMMETKIGKARIVLFDIICIMYYFSKLIFPTFLTLLTLDLTIAQNQKRFEANLTYEQAMSIIEAYIMEYNYKKCYVLPTKNPNSCKNYCRNVYYYVPSLPYKNARGFNTTTRHCYSIPICPDGATLDKQSNKCKNSNGRVVNGMDARPHNN